MRLWTLHPRYLDAQGLVGAWREGLLAQKVLAGATRGYTRHPQLTRFRLHPRPLRAIAVFLLGIAEEADRRGYRFDRSKILYGHVRGRLSETRGQLLYEWRHLREKLRSRSPRLYRQLRGVKSPRAHPLFRIRAGRVRFWERV